MQSSVSLLIRPVQFGCEKWLRCQVKFLVLVAREVFTFKRIVAQYSANSIELIVLTLVAVDSSGTVGVVSRNQTAFTRTLTLSLMAKWSDYTRLL